MAAPNCSPVTAPVNGTNYVALISAVGLEALENFRSVAYASNLAALTLALPEIQSCTGLSVTDFRAKVQASVKKLKTAAK
jgi:hypothetical protein